MRDHFFRLLPCLMAVSILVVCVAAQARVTVPARFADRPGNASLSMPLRWSIGRMQVVIAGSAVPAQLRGKTVTALQLRRPPTSDTWPARTVDLEVTLATSDRLTPTNPLIDLDLNLTICQNVTQVVPPTSIVIPPVPVPVRDDEVGQDLIDVQLTTPFAVPADATLSLVVDITSTAASFSAPESHWVDAVWRTSDDGYGAAIGQHGCGTLPEATKLRPVRSGLTPRDGGSFEVELTGVPRRQPGALLFGLRGSAATAPPPFASGCTLWLNLAIPLFATPVTTGPFGDATFSQSLVSGTGLEGIEFMIQAVVFDAAELLLSNPVVGVLDEIGVDSARFTTLLVPGDGSNPFGDSVTPFLPFAGLVPVLGFTTN